MGLHDWIYYAVDNPVTRGTASTVWKVAEVVGASTKQVSPTITKIPEKTLWQLSGTGRFTLRLAAVSGAAAVCLGAYGAHRQWPEGDKDELKRRKQFEIANNYHFYHTLALVTIPLSKFPLLSGALFSVGTTLFCGSIYYSSITGNKKFNSLAPCGGITLIIAWLSLIL